LVFFAELKGGGTKDVLQSASERAVGLLALYRRFFWLWREQVAILVRLYWRSVHLCGLPAAPGIFHFFILICEKPGRRTPGEANGAGRAGLSVDDVVIAWVGAVIFPLLLFFLENRIV
jgi:hypothetical protein